MKSIFITKFAYLNNDFMKDTSLSSRNKGDNSERIMNHNFNSYNFNNQKNFFLPNTHADNPINIYKTNDEKRDFSFNQCRNKNLINNISTHQKKENYNKSRNKGPFSSYFTGKFHIFNSFNYSKTLDFEIKNSSRRNYESFNHSEEKKNLNYKFTQKTKFKNNFIQSLKKKKLNKKLMLKLSPINNLTVNYDKNKKKFQRKINDKIIENQTIEKTLESQTLENLILDNQNNNELINLKMKKINNQKIGLYKKLENKNIIKDNNKNNNLRYSQSNNLKINDSENIENKTSIINNNNISENIDLKKKKCKKSINKFGKKYFFKKKSNF